jgi:hypothetical protein
MAGSLGSGTAKHAKKPEKTPKSLPMRCFPEQNYRIHPINQKYRAAAIDPISFDILHR